MTNRKQMTIETLFENYQSILKETLKVLPVGYIPAHTYENIPSIVEGYVKQNVELYRECEELQKLKGRIHEDYVYFAGFGADANADTEEQLNFLFKSKLNSAQAKSVGREKFFKYKEALEEIVKRPQRSETCRMIAQKALGLLNDDEYQPELLIEENLKLKIELEDLKTKITQKELDKVFKPENKRTCNSTELTDTYENSSLTHCKHCGEYIGYHHWEFCKGNGTSVE